MIYDILLSNSPVGIAKVKRRGLFYEITCRDRIKSQHTIEVRCGVSCVNLGICVPFDDGYGFNTKTPVKAIGEGELGFYAIPCHTYHTFVPVASDRPFLYLKHITRAKLSHQSNTVGLVIINPDEDQ